VEALVLERVTVKYGKETALVDVTARFEPGRIYGVVGPDGAGKSTLLKVLAGLIRPSGGSVTRGAAGAIGFVPEHFGLYEEMSVDENLLFAASLYGLTRPEADKRGEELLRRVGLDRFKERLAGRLSGGMKRKLAMMAASVHKPRHLILDEPTNGVDPVSRREIWELIGEMKREGAAVIVSTQYLDEATRCDEVLLLHRGRVLVHEKPDVLLKQFPYRVVRLPEMRREPLALLEDIRRWPGVVDAYPRGAHWVVLVSGAEAEERLKAWWQEKKREGEPERISPDFEDVFIHWMGGGEG
jgi:ABC-2 type transport system ATP-binding protein